MSIQEDLASHKIVILAPLSLDKTSFLGVVA